MGKDDIKRRGKCLFDFRAKIKKNIGIIISHKGIL
jgi:hypothetical protein